MEIETCLAFHLPPSPHRNWSFMRASRQSLLCFWAVIFSFPISVSAENQARPNVVFILTDNHGAWTLGCYGNKEIHTPNIDRLAQEGTLMTRAFSSNPVCSPTRATFLTGLMPSQHGVHCFLHGGRLQIGPEARNTLEEFQSLPEILKSQGYRCGLVGKWHLGDNLHPQEGLDDYWITMPHGGTTEFYDAKIIENGEQRTEPGYLTDLWTDHAVKFIEKEDDRPFFLYLAYNGPYALGRLLLVEGKNRHAEYYKNVDLTSFPKEKSHPWQFNNLDYMNNPVSNRRVATEVSGIDDGVGRVMKALRDQGLDENTIVVFAADQGWAGGHGGFYGMGDHTRPVTATDEMMQIPMIWRHPRQIKAGQKSDLMVSNYDFFPTLLGHLNLKHLIDQAGKLPGRDFSSLLKGEEIADWQQEVFYEFEFLRTLRTDRWKLTRRYPDGPNELFDLQEDPAEQNNIYSDDSTAVQSELQKRLDKFFSEHASPKYDLLNGGVSQTVLFNPPVESPAKTELVSLNVNDEFDKSHLIHIPEGYAVEKVASSALVQHPMMAAFDDRGRLFVAESAGLNLRNDALEEELPNSIKMLEDEDRDGTFDKVTVFADKMTLPMGACWYRDSLYVASPPHIWKLQDTDGDGVADVREKFAAKFGYSGNAASVHGCFLSPDGRIYWCDGRHGHELEDEQGNVTSKRAGSYIFSCRPDGSDLQVHCGGGMDNPVEVDFTESGDVLGTVNIMYSSPRIDCLVHWLHGGTYPHSQRVLGEFARTGDLLGPVHQFGHVAVSGTTRYRSGALDRSFTDNMFVTIFNTGQVVRIDLEKSGSTYRSSQHEFLTCSDPDFHPTDILEDADGSLLLVDTGGWFRIGCPTSQIAKPDVRGGIYRIRKAGMSNWTDPRGLGINWSELSNRSLINLLMDTRYAVRERAIDECALRGDAILNDLKTSMTRGDIRVRTGAAWACTRIATESVQEIVRAGFKDRDETVRAIACKSAGVTGDRQAASSLIGAMKDTSPHVRRAALTSLGQLKAESAVPAILALAPDVADRSENHALVYALIEINSPEQTALGLESPNAATRLAAIIALDEIAPDQLSAEKIAKHVSTGDSETLGDLLVVLQNHADWDTLAARLLSLWGEGKLQSNSDDIQSFIQLYAGSQVVQSSLQTIIERENTTSEQLLTVFNAIASSTLRSLPESLHAGWQKSLSSAQYDVSCAALRALQRLEHPFQTTTLEIAEDSEATSVKRLLALEASRPKTLSELTFEFLVEVIESGTPPREVERAVAILGAVNLSNRQLEVTSGLIPTAGPLELQGLTKVIARVSDQELLVEFAKALTSARSRKSLTVQQLTQLASKWSAEPKDALQPLLLELKEMEGVQLEKLDRLEPLAKSASSQRGHDIFFSEKAKCATCHQVGDRGGKIGPNLSAIGLIRRERDLLEAILFPSRSFAREYEPYSVVTGNGKIVSGLISSENAASIFVQQATGDPVEISRDDIETIVPAAVSVMPQGLETGLTEEQLADLVAFLRSLNTAPQKSGSK